MSKTILYIEDNPDNAEIVENILRKEAYTVFIATDGHTGVQLAEEHQPDLIICDFHLPGLNGPEVIQAIRANAQLEAIPIVMLTADIYSRPDSESLAINAYLNKPIRRNQLLTAIQELL